MEEDNIDPLVAPPLLARPTPSLYYPPSLRLRLPTYAHTYTISRNSRNRSGRYTRVLSRVLSLVPTCSPSKNARNDGPPYYTSCRSFGQRSPSRSSSHVPPASTRPSAAATLVSLSLRVFRVSVRKGRRAARGGALPWPRRIRRRMPRKSCEDLSREACERGTTSLKINSVKEPTDIRGLRKDLTPRTHSISTLSFYLLPCSLFLSLYICSPIHNSVQLSRLSRKRSSPVFSISLFYCIASWLRAFQSFFPPMECFPFTDVSSFQDYIALSQDSNQTFQKKVLLYNRHCLGEIRTWNKSRIMRCIFSSFRINKFPIFNNNYPYKYIILSFNYSSSKFNGLYYIYYDANIEYASSMMLVIFICKRTRKKELLKKFI